MAKVHETYSAGQFLTGNLNHFTVTKTGMAASDMKAVIEGAGTRATVVLVGAIDGNDVRIACLLYTSPSPRDHPRSRMPSSA